jgi:hypothetical protein
MRKHAKLAMSFCFILKTKFRDRENKKKIKKKKIEEEE